MNDEIKLAAKKYASMYIDDYYNQHKESFEAGANFATEKCQEEIKRLKTQVRYLYDHRHTLTGDDVCHNCELTKGQIKELEKFILLYGGNILVEDRGECQEFLNKLASKERE